MAEDGGRGKANGHRCIHRKALDWAHSAYYRYSVETGICVLEWWEAALVNLYFLLLLSSLARQMVRIGIYLIEMLLKYRLFLGRS
ncbi:ECU02_0705 [Encephalitozoon cuniculi GB-M1]|uniref:ECU02_0705 protein n=1 Tax=Encephalitozoon cuniculi (strain GB-M1) TaxID=284813 RepID=I7IV34_ENCCU|nr:uncharacterized protein ECU02_0705 [Encephalitozoon cuniculi GB-M1]CCI73911.1 ECU02_0705 [Encephalitozoon cuniculi GB-M1]